MLSQRSSLRLSTLTLRRRRLPRQQLPSPLSEFSVFIPPFQFLFYYLFLLNVFSPFHRTSVSTLVSTAYLDNSGSTIAIMKRDAQPTNIELTKRNVGVPTYFAGYARADILFTCQCLFTKAPAPITRVLAARPFVCMSFSFFGASVYPSADFFDAGTHSHHHQGSSPYHLLQDHSDFDCHRIYSNRS